MSQPMIDVAPDITNLMTEDDTPVDNLPSEKQQRLLTEPLYSSWTPEADEEHPAPRTFLADANVGVFYSVRQPPLVPDMFLSLDVEVNKDWRAKENHSYLVWEFGKVPEVVVEVVSDTKGNELSRRLHNYVRMGIVYCVVFDPLPDPGNPALQVFEYSSPNRYRLRDDFVLQNLRRLSRILQRGLDSSGGG